MNGPKLSPQERKLWAAALDLIGDGYENEEAAARLVDTFATGPEDVEETYYAALAALENLRAELRRTHEAEEEADAEAVADINARHARRLAEIERRTR